MSTSSSCVTAMGDSLHPLTLPFMILFLPSVLSKVFTRCELARELSQPRHRIPAAEVATWVCIARHESEYNTSAIGHLNADGSGDHGLFQISDQYWCSPPGVGLACGLNCDQLEDDDIKDDVICARRIYRAHKRRTGDGFTAWAVYGFHCRGDVSMYTEGCDEQDTTSTSSTENYWRTTSTTEKPYEYVSSTTEMSYEGTSSTTEMSYEDTSSTTEEEPFIDESTVESTAEEPTSESYTDDRKARPPLSSRHQSTLAFPSKNIPKSLYKNPLVARHKPLQITSVKKPLITTPVVSRTSGTSSFGTNRPTFSDPGLDPATAWLQIHNDPRFLDKYP